MPRIANRDARSYVERRLPFTGSNMYAELKGGALFLLVEVIV